MIPEITDEELESRLSRIKPLVRYRFDIEKGECTDEQDDLGILHYIDLPENRRSASFLWSPVRRERAFGEIKTIGRIITYHSCAYYGFFKPSLSEIMAQIPPDLVDKINAFELFCLGDKRAVVWPEANYHWAVCQLYFIEENRK